MAVLVLKRVFELKKMFVFPPCLSFDPMLVHTYEAKIEVVHILLWLPYKTLGCHLQMEDEKFKDQ